MPATSEAQQKLMAIALGIKRGEIPKSYSSEAAELADSMTEAQLRDFAQKAEVQEEEDNDMESIHYPRPIPGTAFQRFYDFIGKSTKEGDNKYLKRFKDTLSDLKRQKKELGEKDFIHARKEATMNTSDE